MVAPAFKNYKRSTIELTNLHEALLVVLSHRVRLLTNKQIKQAWTLSETELSELEVAGFIRRESKILHPELVLSAPLVTWSKGETDPNFYPIARQTRGRWQQAPIETHIVLPTKKAKELVGGYNVAPRESEYRHDITLSGLYCKYLVDFPDLACHWVHGDTLRAERRFELGTNVPDAVIESANGSGIERIVEFAGSYNRQKLERMHQEYRQLGATYELW